MLTSNRQEKLNPILVALRAIPGITAVYQDDFDSSGINLFINLEVKRVGWSFSSNRNKPMAFSHPLRSITNAIRKACKNVPFNMGDVPKMKTRKVKVFNVTSYEQDGYDDSSISLSVWL